jgi:hypothetical protein
MPSCGSPLSASRPRSHLRAEVRTYDAGRYFNPNLTKAQIQQDMKEAEQAGIVSIQRTPPGSAANFYALTRPGRKWTLEKQAELRGLAPEGMRTQPRYS